jgi:tetratricopeptide (TPR) repeat protein
LLAVAPDARAARLDTIGAVDPALAESLRRRLDSLGSATVGGSEAAVSAFTAELPRRFGNFLLVRQLGVGGMGEVWLAEQDHPRRQIALKLIRSGLGSDEMVRRFQREATLAGRAEHPSIARVYEAGHVATEHGPVPYLAMEYVVGQGLREYLRERAPSMRERLALLAVIAEAVHHAHVRGVIHRDLKPQNILVGPDGAPKVLDFGVARALEDSTPGATRMTMAGQLIGTIAYMSPEQLSGDALSVDARSDVYALGVIAYEALSGEAPFKLPTTSSILDAIQARARQRPEPLSRWLPQARGDVELIVMKALADEPDRRYQTAHEFAEDIQRYLDAQPIRARAPTTTYLWSRFARRHRIGLIAGGLVLVAVIAGAVVSVRYAIAEAEARREAELRTAKAEAVTAFLHDMLANADPTNARGSDLKLSEVLASAARTLDVSPPREPEVEVGIRGLLVEIFRNIGEPEVALTQLAAAKTASARAYAPNAIEVLDLDRIEASVLLDLDRVDQATERLGALEERMRRVDAPATLKLAVATQNARAEVVRGNFDAALKIVDTGLAATDLPRTHETVLAARVNRSVILSELGRFEDASKELEGLIADRSAILGDEHPKVTRLRAELGVVYDGQGKAVEAEALMRQVVAEEIRVYGADNAEPIATSMNLIKLLIDRGAFDEAEPMLDHAIEVQTRIFGNDHERVRIARNMRAVLFEERGAPDRARREYQAIIDSYGRTLGFDHPDGLVARNNLAKLYLTQGQVSEAVVAYATIVKDAKAKLGDRHFYTAIFIGNYGDALRQAGDPAAVSVLEEAYALCVQALGARHERTRRVADWLGQAAAARGDSEGERLWHERAADAP